MKIESSISGCLPRPPGLISATRKYDRSRISDEELESSYRRHTEKVIKAQIESGLNYINDGFLKRQDLLRHFTVKLNGVDVGQLYRWFDNNTFYRIPIIKGKISGNPPFNDTYTDLLPEYKLKAVLPAPYTFVKLSKNQYYEDISILLTDFAEVLNKEIRSLEKKGYDYIQLSDPALVYHKTVPNRELLQEIAGAVEVATQDVEARTCLHTFFGDLAPIINHVLDWSVDDLGFDCYETDVDSIKEYSFKGGLSLGLVDARNTLQENVDELVALSNSFIEESNPERLIVSTNCDLDFLTWEKAQSKLLTVTNVAEQLREEDQ